MKINSITSRKRMSSETTSARASPFMRRRWTLEIAGAGIFIALSAVISAITTPILPRVPYWGIAILDPISAVWITCFLIFGWRSGFLCLGGGSLLLFFWDPTGIGPFFKFFATLPFILVPTLVYYLGKKMGKTEVPMRAWIFNVKTYSWTMIAAYGLRIVLMIFCNFVVFATIYAPYLQLATLAFFGLPQITAWDAVIFMAIIINSWQTVFDVVVPYLITFKIGPKYMVF